CVGGGGGWECFGAFFFSKVCFSLFFRGNIIFLWKRCTNTHTHHRAHTHTHTISLSPSLTDTYTLSQERGELTILTRMSASSTSTPHAARRLSRCHAVTPSRTHARTHERTREIGRAHV